MNWLTPATPRTRMVLACVSALLAALAQPLALGSFTELTHGYNGVCAFVALTPLLWSLKRVSMRESWTLMFLFGFFYFAITISWVFVAMNTYGGIGTTASLFVTILLCAALATYTSVGGVAIRATLNAGIPLTIAAPMAWITQEFLRTWVFSGFPWASLAYSQWKLLPIAQSADLAGPYAIILILVSINAALTEWVDGGCMSFARSTRSVRFQGLGAAGLAAAALLYGSFRLHQTQPRYEIPPVRIALLQGNIPQDHKHSEEWAQTIIDRYNTQTSQAVAAGAEIVVWPEGALPPPVHRNLQRMPEPYLATPPMWTLIGAAAYWHEGKRTYLHNSTFLVDANREVLGRSDKVHLVPFGEYLPFRLPGYAQRLVEASGDFVPGEWLAPLRAGTVHLGILTCYEDIFPELSRGLALQGAQVLIATSNVAWFGRTSAPYQHLSMSVFRAIENRLPVVRAANTGISAFIDSRGRVTAATEIFTEAVLSATIHPRTAASVYLLTGDSLAWICTLSCGALSLFWVAQRLRRGYNKRHEE